MSSFNPNEHMMKLKNKDYLQVMWRLVWFREDHPNWALESNALTIDDDHAVFKAIVCDENGVQKSVGHGSESKRDFGDFIEKAETKAVGRALAMLGYGTQFAADELDEGERIVDSPVNRTKVEGIKADTDGTAFRRNAWDIACKQCGLNDKQMQEAVKELKTAGLCADKQLKDMTMQEFNGMIKAAVSKYGKEIQVR